MFHKTINVYGVYDILSKTKSSVEKPFIKNKDIPKYVYNVLYTLLHLENDSEIDTEFFYEIKGKVIMFPFIMENGKSTVLKLYIDSNKIYLHLNEDFFDLNDRKEFVTELANTLEDLIVLYDNVNEDNHRLAFNFSKEHFIFSRSQFAKYSGIKIPNLFW